MDLRNARERQKSPEQFCLSWQASKFYSHKEPSEKAQGRRAKSKAHKPGQSISVCTRSSREGTQGLPGGWGRSQLYLLLGIHSARPLRLALTCCLLLEDMKVLWTPCTWTHSHLQTLHSLHFCRCSCGWAIISLADSGKGDTSKILRWKRSTSNTECVDTATMEFTTLLKLWSFT